MPSRERTLQLATPPTGSWVQVEREALEALAGLGVRHPSALAVLSAILSQMGRGNALVASQATLARLAGCTDRTVRRALTVLRDGKWLEVRQLGASGSVNAYVVNDRVAWVGARDGMRYSTFSARVLLADDEQPDRADLGNQPPLQQLAAVYPGEQQLPVGPGLPPPSQPHLDGLEPDLPVRHEEAPSPPPARRSRKP